MKAQKKNIVLKLSSVCITILLCYMMLSNYYALIDKKDLQSQISSLGFPVLVIILPYFIIILNDTWGWLNCFKKKLFISARKLFFIRVATETLQTSLPGGAVYAELVRPFLLKKYLHLEYPDSIASNIITKINILVAQTIFLIFGLLLLVTSFTKKISSTSLLPVPVFYILISLFFSITFLLTYMLYRKNLLLLLIRMMAKIKLQRVSRIVEKIRKPVIDINNTISLFSRENKTRLFLTILLFLFTWVLMAFESLVIVTLMGIEASIFQMIFIESMISFVRMAFFFIPGAVGPQDISIIFLFKLTGLPDPLTNAFIFTLLKRSKELFWIIIGYILLLFMGIVPHRLFAAKQREVVALQPGHLTKSEASG